MREIAQPKRNTEKFQAVLYEEAHAAIRDGNVRHERQAEAYERSSEPFQTPNRRRKKNAAWGARGGQSALIERSR